MRLRKQNAASNAPAAQRVNPATPPTAPPPRRKRWLVFAAIAVLIAAAGWGAWTFWRPSPLQDARTALDRRDFAAANELLAKHLAKHPDDAPTRLLAARAARRAGELEPAFQHLRVYREKKGSDAAFELESALLRTQGGSQSEADRLFAEYAARPESPDTPLVMEAYLIGKLAYLAPRADKQANAAIADATVVANLKQAVELWLRLRPGKEDQVQGRVWRGRVLIFAGDHAAGIAALREALELDPNHFDARFVLALSIAQPQPDEARQHLEILHARHPEHHYLRYGLATTYRMLGRLKDSRELLETLQTGPAALSALVELALIDMDEGKLADAERRLQQALEKAPNSPEIVIAMSRCHALAGRPEKAEEFRKRFDELVEKKHRQHAPKP